MSDGRRLSAGTYRVADVINDLTITVLDMEREVIRSIEDASEIPEEVKSAAIDEIRVRTEKIIAAIPAKVRMRRANA